MIIPRSHIAAVELSGAIGSRIRASEYAWIFDSIGRNKRVKSVLLIIDSPGGSATDSGYLQSSIAKLAETKPVVAFVQGMAASGAYMAASPATKIIAVPSALVGSIGVISVMPILRGLLDRLGINVEVVKSGRLKDMGLFHREPTEEERKKEQELSDEIYNDFVDTVAKFRKLENDHVRNLATGEIFTAKKAMQLGLVDELGDHTRDGASLAIGKCPKTCRLLEAKKGILATATPNRVRLYISQRSLPRIRGTSTARNDSPSENLMLATGFEPLCVRARKTGRRRF